MSSSSSTPQFTLYSHASGPNPWKVVIVLEELGLTYNTVYLDFNTQDQKKPEFTKYNPNGRVPAIVDHKNNDFVLWESNAILEYLVTKYDTKHIISVDSNNIELNATQRQWLFFQASGQGPYFGQGAWFSFYHKDKIPSAIERYNNEIKRVSQVLEDVLKTTKNNYLVDGRYTIADLSFVPWFEISSRILPAEFKFDEAYPTLTKWLNTIRARPAVAKALAERTRLNAPK